MIDFNPQILTFENVDRFYIKRSIYQFIKANSFIFNGFVLDVGCGEMPYRKEILINTNVTKYVSLDIHSALEYKKGVKPDFLWDGINMPFEDSSFDSAFATEVLEHCSDPSLTLKEIHRVLKPNSPLLLTVPFLWPTHESPYDFYRYTPFSLKNMLGQTGYKNIEIECLGGWDATLGQLICLWIKRRGFSILKQKLLYRILKPIIQLLYNRDKIHSAYKDQIMFTNLGVKAWKI